MKEILYDPWVITVVGGVSAGVLTGIILNAKGGDFSLPGCSLIAVIFGLCWILGVLAISHMVAQLPAMGISGDKASFFGIATMLVLTIALLSLFLGGGD